MNISDGSIARRKDTLSIEIYQSIISNHLRCALCIVINKEASEELLTEIWCVYKITGIQKR